jgi:flagellar hook-basal body complex protein FliE
MTVLPIAPVGGLQDAAAIAPAATPAPSSSGGFARMLLDGVEQANHSVLSADQAVKAFAVDDSVPLHQVTFALEQARLATELMMQVRSRLLEGYQEIMRMQL